MDLSILKRKRTVMLEIEERSCECQDDNMKSCIFIVYQKDTGYKYYYSDLTGRDRAMLRTLDGKTGHDTICTPINCTLCGRHLESHFYANYYSGVETEEGEIVEDGTARPARKPFLLNCSMLFLWLLEGCDTSQPRETELQQHYCYRQLDRFSSLLQEMRSCAPMDLPILHDSIMYVYHDDFYY